MFSDSTPVPPPVNKSILKEEDNRFKSERLRCFIHLKIRLKILLDNNCVDQSVANYFQVIQHAHLVQKHFVLPIASVTTVRFGLKTKVG